MKEDAAALALGLLAEEASADVVRCVVLEARHGGMLLRLRLANPSVRLGLSGSEECWAYDSRQEFARVEEGQLSAGQTRYFVIRKLMWRYHVVMAGEKS